MTGAADVETLPLPGWAHSADKLLCDTDWLRTQVSEYARANVAHATAAKDAEIEALRAEVERWKRAAVRNLQAWHGEVSRACTAEARVERLVESVRTEIPVLRQIAGFGNMSDGMTDEVADRLEAALREQESKT